MTSTDTHGGPVHPGPPGHNPAAGAQRGEQTSIPARTTRPDPSGSPTEPGRIQADPAAGLASLLGLATPPGASAPQPAARRPHRPATSSTRAAKQDAAAAGPDVVPVPAPDRLLHTPEQAAGLLQIPASWLRKKAAAGLIPSTLLGRHLRFSQQDIDDIIRAASRARRRRT